VVLQALRLALSRLPLSEQHVLVATSGGVDSTVLLYGLRELSEEFGLKLSVGHVNHGLRGAGSEADEASVHSVAATLGLDFASRQVEPQAVRRDAPSSRRLTLQEAARQLRYRALHSMSDELGADLVATGHNANDQAETLLLRMLRGTGPAGLVGIPVRSRDGRVIRPLLRVSRRDIETWARGRGLSWREDPSNRSLGYARNRLREQWLPGLARDFNPQLLRAIGDLAEAQYWESQWFEAEVDREAAARFLLDGDSLWIERKDWAALPVALARRLARRALHEVGGGRWVSRVHLERMLDFLAEARPHARLELPGGLQLERQGMRFRLSEVSPLPVARC
jgi:tRNA(Ile)-lysidine synthase